MGWFRRALVVVTCAGGLVTLAQQPAPPSPAAPPPPSQTVPLAYRSPSDLGPFVEVADRPPPVPDPVLDRDGKFASRLHLATRWEESPMRKERWGIRRTDQGEEVFGERTVDPSTPAHPNVTRERFITVSIRNDGEEDLKDAPAEIVLYGENPAQFQRELVKLNVPQGTEAPVDIVIRRYPSFYIPSSGFLGFTAGPNGRRRQDAIKTVTRVEVTVPVRFTSEEP